MSNDTNVATLDEVVRNLDGDTALEIAAEIAAETAVQEGAPTSNEVSETALDAREALELCRSREARKQRTARKVQGSFDRALYARTAETDPDLAWLFAK